MDKNLLEKVKEKLTEQRQKIVGLLEGMTREKTFNKDKVQVKWSDMGDKEEDNAVEVANFQDNISLERNLETNLEKIEKALEKIKNKTYGQCEKCGQPISDERLLAYPEARNCIDCHKQQKV